MQSLPVSALDQRTAMMSPRQAMKLKSVVIGVIGFLTLVDLFGTQAILPTLAMHYGASPASIGFAVNATTIGMAISCIGVALISQHIDRRHGVWISLALLAIPTSLLAFAPDLAVFTILRVVQGIFMAAAFTLTMTYLAEHFSAGETARALAAYITGVVASNLVGRLVSATATDLLGLHANFFLFAALNLAGAALVYLNFDRMAAMASSGRTRSPLESWAEHLRNPALRASFAIGFLILFAFIGVFTYVNFVLSGAPISLNSMSLGIIYFVFLPSMITTPLSGEVATRIGTRPALWLGLLIAGVGLGLLLSSKLEIVLAGMVLVGVGTFFAQAVGTGFVGRAAAADRGAASGLYLASYYLGGLVGGALLGQIFDRFGWSACVLTVAVSLVLAAIIGLRLEVPEVGSNT